MKTMIIEILLYSFLITGITIYTAQKYYKRGFSDGYDYGVYAYEETCKKMIGVKDE